MTNMRAPGRQVDSKGKYNTARGLPQQLTAHCSRHAALPGRQRLPPRAHAVHHALYLWLWPRPGGMRLQLGETRRVAGQRHQRTLTLSRDILR